MKKLFSLLTLLAFAVFQPLGASAQSWPQHQNSYINDYADLIDEASAAKLRAQLQDLRAKTGVEFTILTLPDRKPFQSAGSYEDFSIGLFNEWNIGDSEKKDGILLLVLRDSRELSIELGAGYDVKYDAVAGEIIDDVITPAFRDGDYSRGIVAGADAIMARIVGYEPVIAQAPATAQPPVSTEKSGEAGSAWKLLLGLGGGLVALIFGVKFIGRLQDSMRRCPSCNQRGLQVEKKTLQKATRETEGQGEKTETCPHCGYEATTPFTIAKLADPNKGDGDKNDDNSFGGGSSSGGGASGKW